ncbi:TPA: flippase [Serratia fonticola]
MSSLKRNVISLFVLQGSNYIIPLITFPYLVRVLGPTGYGSLGIGLALIQYFSLFIDFGFNLSSTRKIAKNRDDIDFVSGVFWETIIAKSILLILSIFAIFIVVHCSKGFYEIKGIVYALSLQLIGSVLLPTWFFQGIEKMSKVTISYILARGCTVPLIFVFVISVDDAWKAALIQGGGALLAGLISCILVFKTKMIIRTKVSLGSVIFSMRESFPLFIGAVAISLYTMSTPFILGIVSTKEQVGYYVASDRIRQALLGVFLILGNAFYPRVNVLMKQSSILAFAFLRKLLYIQGTITFIFSFILYLSAGLIASILLGNQYPDASFILKIMSPMVFLVTTSVILCNYILLPMGHNHLYAKIPIVTSVVHICYSIPLCAYFGAEGGAIAILLTEIITLMILMAINFKKGYLKRIFLING